MTGANMNLVTVDIDVAPDAEEPKQKLDDGEHIVKRLVPLKELQKTLHGECFWLARLTTEYAEKGYAIDALVASVAVGLNL